VSFADSSYNPNSSAYVPGPVSNNGDNDDDDDDHHGSVETPYRPLAEHFSHYGRQGNIITSQTNEGGRESPYAPLYGTLNQNLHS
jgi:hypothetical protein